MGADGHIAIWRDDKVRERFPNCDDLFGSIPNHYADELDGTKYHHVYWGDNQCVYWDSEEDWLVSPYWPKTPEEKAARHEACKPLREFVAWLEANMAAQWEVWT